MKNNFEKIENYIMICKSNYAVYLLYIDLCIKAK